MVQNKERKLLKKMSGDIVNRHLFTKFGDNLGQIFHGHATGAHTMVIALPCSSTKQN